MKPRIVKDREDRIYDYEQWCRKQDNLPVINIDGIEFRLEDGYLKIVGVLELTRFDAFITPADRETAWRRVNNSKHGAILRQVADALGVKAYLVVYLADLSEFHVRRLSGDASLPSTWVRMGKARYIRWRRGLSRG